MITTDNISHHRKSKRNFKKVVIFPLRSVTPQQKLNYICSNGNDWLMKGFKLSLWGFALRFGYSCTNTWFLFKAVNHSGIIKRLVKKGTQWFCSGISRKRAAGWLQHCAAPRCLNASNHLCDLIPRGLN